MIVIDDYLIDVATSEEHSYESEVTEYPVESGSSISDNIRPKPIEVTIEGVVSDFPLSPLIVDARATATSSPSQEALEKLLRIRDAREPVRITTGLKIYESMVLRSLSIPQDAETGQALKFRATFVQVKIVENKRTFVRVATSQVGAGKKKDFGKQVVRTVKNVVKPLATVTGILVPGFDPKAFGKRGTITNDATGLPLSDADKASYDFVTDPLGIRTTGRGDQLNHERTSDGKDLSKIPEGTVRDTDGRTLSIQHAVANWGV